MGTWIRSDASISTAVCRMKSKLGKRTLDICKKMANQEMNQKVKGFQINVYLYLNTPCSLYMRGLKSYQTKKERNDFMLWNVYPIPLLILKYNNFGELFLKLLSPLKIITRNDKIKRWDIFNLVRAFYLSIEQFIKWL